jgi:hypothetical protein
MATGSHYFNENPRLPKVVPFFPMIFHSSIPNIRKQIVPKRRYHSTKVHSTSQKTNVGRIHLNWTLNIHAKSNEALTRQWYFGFIRILDLAKLVSCSREFPSHESTWKNWPPPHPLHRTHINLGCLFTNDHCKRLWKMTPLQRER